MSSSDMRNTRRARRGKVRVNGFDLSFLEAGEGPVVVFVHGSVTTSEMFRDTLEHFADRYRAIAVDLRGYGDSDKPGGYTMKQYSEDLLALLDALKLNKAVLVGVSMGGMVVQQFALDHQDRLVGLVLCATSYGELAPGVLEGDVPELVRKAGWRKISEGLVTGAFPLSTDPAIVNALLSQVDTWDEATIVGALQAVKDFDSLEQLPRIKVPALIMAGTEDHQMPVPISQRMHQAVAGSRLEIFEGIGHFIMVEDPPRYRRVLGEFLKKAY